MASFLKAKVRSAENIVFILSLISSIVYEGPFPALRARFLLVKYSRYYLQTLEGTGACFLYFVQNFFWTAVHL